MVPLARDLAVDGVVMGRPADQIEALQARVRELEGRLRAYESERAHLFSVIGPQCKEPDGKGFPCCYPTWPKHDDHNGKAGPYATEEIRAAYFAANPRSWDAPPADVPPVLVAGDALDEDEAPSDDARRGEELGTWLVGVRVGREP
jgi:hypothetical protein